MNNIDEKLKELNYERMNKTNMFYKYKKFALLGKMYTISMNIFIEENKIINYMLTPLNSYVESQEEIDFIQKSYNDLLRDVEKVMEDDK